MKWIFGTENCNAPNWDYKLSSMPPDIEVKDFKYGLVTRIEDDALPRGAASDAKGWFSKGDMIELRGGQAVKGTTITGSGGITGLKVSKQFNGTERLIATYARKIKYWDATTEDWIEIGTNQLPAAASGEDIAIDAYHSLAGAFFYISSLNSSIYKL